MFMPKAHNGLNGICRHPVVRVNAGIQLSRNVAISSIMGAVHALIFLPDDTNLEICLFGPFLNFLVSVVLRTVIDHEPLEVARSLSAQTAVGPLDSMASVISRRENCESSHIRSEEKSEYHAAGEEEAGHDTLAFGNGQL